MNPFPANLPALTSVRFLLALGVVLFHYQLQWPWDAFQVTNLLDRLRLGVDVFFILSGFVLTHAYRRAIEAGELSYGRFLVARLARIYPAHATVLLYVCIVVAGALIMGSQYDGRLYSLLGLAASFLLVQAWFSEIVTQWNGPSWSLSAEWFAYLAFPLYAWIGLRLRRRPWLLLVLAVAVFVAVDQTYMALFGKSVTFAEGNLGILRIVPEFLYGVALYRLGERLALSGAAAGLLTAGAAAGMLVLMHFGVDDRATVALAGPLVLGLAQLSRTGADVALSRPWMVASGEASYALYLVHLPILVTWKGLHSVIEGHPSNYTFDWWELAVLLVITLAAAFALHYLLEVPARRMIRRWSDARLGDPDRQARMPAGTQPPDV